MAVAQEQEPEAQPQLEVQEGGEPKKNGKGKLIFIVLLAVLLAGGLFVKSKMAGGGKKKQPVKAEPGPKLDLGDEMVINLKGGGFLRIKLAVEVKAGTDAKKMEEEMAPLRDAAISVLSAKSRTELLTEEGKEKAKAELAKKINGELGKELVQKVFYTYFAIQ